MTSNPEAVEWLEEWYSKVHPVDWRDGFILRSIWGNREGRDTPTPGVIRDMAEDFPLTHPQCGMAFSVPHSGAESEHLYCWSAHRSVNMWSQPPMSERELDKFVRWGRLSRTPKEEGFS